MRSLPVLAAFAAVALLAPAANAQQADASLAITGLGPLATNETLALMPFQVEMELAQFPCVGQGAQITVALTAAVAPEANATATVQPEAMTFTVPPTQGVTGYSHAQAGLLTVRPAQPGAGNFTARVHAEFAGVTGCTGATAEGLGTDAEAPVTFLAPRAGAASEPGPEMPGPGLALVALAVAAAAVALRRRA